MAAEIRKRFPDADVALSESSGGRFEVSVDGTYVFQKSRLRRHAEPGEVLASIEKLLSR